MANKRVSKVRLWVKASQNQINNYTQANDGAIPLSQRQNLDYWYRFRDGDRNNGDVVQKFRFQPVEIRISLRGSSQKDFDILDVLFFDQADTDKETPITPSDIALADIDRDGNTAIIWNLSISKAKYRYTVIVEAQDGTQIHCDPMIENDWD